MKLTSAEIAARNFGPTTQPAKAPPFAGGNEANVRRNRFLRFRPI